jgi:hypothetical protein
VSYRLIIRVHWNPFTYVSLVHSTYYSVPATMKRSVATAGNNRYDSPCSLKLTRWMNMQTMKKEATGRQVHCDTATYP